MRQTFLRGPLCVAALLCLPTAGALQAQETEDAPVDEAMPDDLPVADGAVAGRGSSTNLPVPRFTEKLLGNVRRARSRDSNLIGSSSTGTCRCASPGNWALAAGGKTTRAGGVDPL